MSSKSSVDIRVPVQMLENKLADALKANGDKHAQLIAHTITEHLIKSDAGIEQVCMAYMGYEIDIPYVVGDEVWASVASLGSYSWDKEEMIRTEMIVNDHVKCTIKTITKYSAYHLYVSYTCLRKNSKTGVVAAEDSSSSIRVSDVVVKPDCKLQRPNMGDLI